MLEWTDDLIGRRIEVVSGGYGYNGHGGTIVDKCRRCEYPCSVIIVSIDGIGDRDVTLGDIEFTHVPDNQPLPLPG